MKRFFIFLLAAWILSGCADSARHLRSQPVTTIPGIGGSQQNTFANALNIKMLCAVSQDYGEHSGASGSPERECLYVTADLSGLNFEGEINSHEQAIGIRDKSDRLERGTRYLLMLSDYNCSNYMQRVFAQKMGQDFTQALISDISTGTTGIVSFMSPRGAAALSLGGVIANHGFSEFNSTYFMGKTFQALESAIAAQRQRVKTYIETRLYQNSVEGKEFTAYPAAQALSDVRAYDDACSFKAGLDQLVQIAAQQRQSDEAKATQVAMEPATGKAIVLGRISGDRSAPTRAGGASTAPEGPMPRPTPQQQPPQPPQQPPSQPLPPTTF